MFVLGISQPSGLVSEASVKELSGLLLDPTAQGNINEVNEK